ncbi:Hypothetical predicted protein, partial [Pelobates cultripes]
LSREKTQQMPLQPGGTRTGLYVVLRRDSPKRWKTQKSQVQTPKDLHDINTLYQCTPSNRDLEQAESVACNPLTEDSVDMDVSGPEPPTPVSPITTTSMVPAKEEDIDIH